MRKILRIFVLLLGIAVLTASTSMAEYRNDCESRYENCRRERCQQSCADSAKYYEKNCVVRCEQFYQSPDMKCYQPEPCKQYYQEPCKKYYQAPCKRVCPPRYKKKPYKPPCRKCFYCLKCLEDCTCKRESTCTESLSMTRRESVYVEPVSVPKLDLCEKPCDPKQPAKKWCSSCRAPAGVETDQLSKFGRGISNGLTFWIEVPKQIYLTARRRDPLTALVYGTGKGLVYGVWRGATGVFDMVSFLIPPYDSPLICPEFVFEGWEEYPEI